MSRLAPLRPDRVVRAGARAALDLTRASTQFAVGMAGELAGEALLRGVDIALRAPATSEAVERVLGSDLIRDTVADAVRGPVLDALLAEDVLEEVLDRLEEGRAPERVADWVLADGMAEQIAARVVEGPELGRILDVALASEQMQETIAAALDNPAMQRIAANAVDSRVVDEVVRALLASEEVWLLVAEIAESPQVTAALSRQTAGVADQITDEVRERSRDADDWVERTARRLLRRSAASPQIEPPGGAA